MTIHTYYLVYGFDVKKEDYLRIMGYTVEKFKSMSEKEQLEILEIIYDEFLVLQNEEDRDRWLQGERFIPDKITVGILEGWYLHDNEFYCSYSYEDRFIVGGVECIMRSYTHDDERSEKYYVVGIELGKINNWNGEHEVPISSPWHHTSTETISQATYTLCQQGIPFDVIRVIMRYITGSSAQEKLVSLTYNKEWREAIQNSGEINGRGGDTICSVKDKMWKRMFIIPTIKKLTDDCSCCS